MLHPIRDYDAGRSDHVHGIGCSVEGCQAVSAEKDVHAEHERERGEETEAAAAVEVGERNAPSGAPLPDQKRRDQEAAQHEEEIDAKPTAGDQAVGVNGEHEQNRDPAEAVERGDMAESAHALTVRLRARRNHRPVWMNTSAFLTSTS